ncbi:MAG: TetR/AcrR family transcriptional regulator [Pseudomonadota bacterium]
MAEASKPRTRGRPALTPAQVDDMRARIAAAATRLFKSEGYGAVSMRRLAAEIGCAPMTLYNYYPAKIDILRHLWADVLDVVFTRVGQALAGAGPPVDRLKAAGRIYVGYWLDHVDDYRMVFMAEGVTQDEVSVFVLDDVTTQRTAALAETLCAATGLPASSAELKLRLDLMVSGLTGISHGLVTISAYPWSDPLVLVDALVDRIVAA